MYINMGIKGLNEPWKTKVLHHQTYVFTLLLIRTGIFLMSFLDADNSGIERRSASSTTYFAISLLTSPGSNIFTSGVEKSIFGFVDLLAPSSSDLLLVRVNLAYSLRMLCTLSRCFFRLPVLLLSVDICSLYLSHSLWVVQLRQ